MSNEVVSPEVKTTEVELVDQLNGAVIAGGRRQVEEHARVFSPVQIGALAGAALVLSEPAVIEKTARLAGWIGKKVADLIPDVDKDTGKLDVLDAILKGLLVVTAVGAGYYAYKTGKGILDGYAARTVAAVHRTSFWAVAI